MTCRFGHAVPPAPARTKMPSFQLHQPPLLCKYGNLTARFGPAHSPHVSSAGAPGGGGGAGGEARSSHNQGMPLVLTRPALITPLSTTFSSGFCAGGRYITNVICG